MKKLIVLLALTSASFAHALTIVGGLSNFDCYVPPYDYDCDGFEIQLENCDPSDVYHTWDYSAYGKPTVSLTQTFPIHITTVRYHSATVRLQANGMTHFGVSLLKSATKISYAWLHTFLGETVTPVIIPFSDADVSNIGGIDKVHNTITNRAATSAFWVLPYTNKVTRGCHLEELMTNNTIVTDGVPLGSGTNHDQPNRLKPGETWINDEVGNEAAEASDILWFNVYEDKDVAHGGHVPGRLVAVVMGASVTAPAAPQDISGVVQLGDYAMTADVPEMTMEIFLPGSTIALRTLNFRPTATRTYTARLSDAIPVGNYDVRVKGGHWLGRRRANMPIGDLGVQNWNFTLINGDIDGDNAVSILDYSILSDYFDLSSTNATWTTAGTNGFRAIDADLDGDGSVSILDYSQLSDAFDRVGQ